MALEGGERSAARPGRTLHPGKTQYPFYRRMGGPQGRSGRAENFISTGIRSQTIQPTVTIPTELPSPHSTMVHELNKGNSAPKLDLGSLNLYPARVGIEILVHGLRKMYYLYRKNVKL